MVAPLRRAAATAFAGALLALVLCDLWVGGVRRWFTAHALTSSVVASLLVLGVTALIVDEVIARRQRQERAGSVAVQALIVYAQVRLAYDAVVAGLGGERSGEAPEELRSLSTMLLTASPNLFDDPAARRFLEQVQKLTALMVRASYAPRTGADDDRTRLTAEMSSLRQVADPLVARIANDDVSTFVERVSPVPPDGAGAAGT